MRVFAAALVGAALTTVVALGAPATPPTNLTPEQESRILLLVGQLGDASYRTRESASVELVKFGRHAKPALSAGLEHPDAEVRTRCRRLLPLAKALDRAARLEAFEADKEGKLEHDLPGWKRYGKVVGSTGAARDLFIKMQKANSELLEVADTDSDLASQQFNSVVMQMQVRGNMPLPEIAVMFFLATDPEIRTDGQFGFNPVINFLYQGEFQNALRGGPEVPARRLMLAFFENRTDANSTQQAMQMALQFSAKEYLPLAGKIAADKGQQVYARAQAMSVLAKLGGKDQTPALEAIFEDKTVFGPWQWNNLRGTTEIRDVALATAVKLNGGSFKDYGFDVLAQQPVMVENSPYLCGFTDDAKRDAAFKRWKDTKPKKEEPKKEEPKKEDPKP